MKYPAKNNKSLYSKYNAMKARCYRKTSPKYRNYGERGIVICDEWRNDFDVLQIGRIRMVIRMK